MKKTLSNVIITCENEKELCMSMYVFDTIGFDCEVLGMDIQVMGELDPQSWSNVINSIEMKCQDKNLVKKVMKKYREIVAQ